MTEMIAKTDTAEERKAADALHESASVCANSIRQRNSTPVVIASTPHHDNRFRILLGEHQWSRLPMAVQHRFSKKIESLDCRIFVGDVIETQLSAAGRWLAWVARLVGGPLPDDHGGTGPATVLVTESPSLGGQTWTRTYTRRGRFPQTINSVKRFGGPSGLEEYLGRGLVMRLMLEVEAGALVFRSVGYDVIVRGYRISIPSLLTPGTCAITHRDLGAGRFSFELDLTHPWLGRLVHQIAHFEEV